MIKSVAWLQNLTPILKATNPQMSAKRCNQKNWFVAQILLSGCWWSCHNSSSTLMSSVYKTRHFQVAVLVVLDVIQLHVQQMLVSDSQLRHSGGTNLYKKFWPEEEIRSSNALTVHSRCRYSHYNSWKKQKKLPGLCWGDPRCYSATSTPDWTSVHGSDWGLEVTWWLWVVSSWVFTAATQSGVKVYG